MSETIAIETTGVFNASDCHLLNDLGMRISLNMEKARETSFIYQRLLVLMQHFNTAY